MSTPIEDAVKPYDGPRLYGMVDDMITPGALDLDCDERLWVPQGEHSPGVEFRPLMFQPGEGKFVNLLRVRRQGVVSRHRHAGAVQAFTLRGRWHYLEYDWWSEEGSFAFEPPGDVHTLEVPSDCQEMITLFITTGAYIYVDADFRMLGIEDVFSKIDKTREHYRDVGLDVALVDDLIR
ncbi:MULTISPECIES: 2,4'-dihydroxyacetophenone dioxygenase family protein [unclassified Pseudonocardia]|uniref:2,4'-dihydroxyacetophenone dioxygenase family protein n=1 Tax=unclassified Pseudonocardia TaxID=2619320 RepID=UPI0001FFDBC3|nr:2,4'-dihydroxyacetophenone dioxygenase family protein [Pseudonocardia sp. Ae707_Ps1]OLM15913.1 2,4'-dihydroxyacetophenone dioxygenase [Pseudonocardia sp. Ae707_Ps1]